MAGFGCGDDAGGAGSSTAAQSTGTGSTGPSGGSDSTETSGESSSSGGDSGSSGSSGGGFGSDCTEMSDLPPQELLAGVDTIVVVMMENRSFDHMLGALSLEEGLPVDGLTGMESNPDLRGNPIGVFKSDHLVVEEDPPHGWGDSHDQWNRGSNDRFVVAHQNDGATLPEVVMGYHTRQQLLPLFTLASNFVVCDRWFASVMGPTQPNRFHLHLGTSNGLMSNPDIGEGPTELPSIFDRLDDKRVSNTYYSSNIPFPLAYGKATGIKLIGEFFEDAAAGNLPSFCMVEPTLTANGTIGNDDHPPADLLMGQAFLASVYQALAQSPQWERCLLVITYDEHGGFYDHVPPPTTFDRDFPEFQQLGFRVPSVVIGPHVRRGCANSIQLDHVSIPTTAMRKWDLEPMNTRMTMTNDITSAIDPRFIDDPQPPIELPPLLVDVPDSWFYPGGVGKDQIELVRLLDRGGFPKHLDQRGAHDETMRMVLEHGRRLGAVRFR